MVIRFLLRLWLNFAVVVFGLAGQCIRKVMLESVSIQFAETGESIQLDNSLQLTVLQVNLIDTIQIRIFFVMSWARLALIQQSFQLNQIIVDGSPQMWKIQPSKQAVPISVVGLGSVQALLHGAGALFCWQGDITRRKPKHALMHPV